MRFSVVIAILLFSRVLPAQSLAGVVTDTATRRPIPGVVISLLDSTGRVLGRLLTGEAGTYRVTNATAVRRLRAQRLGYRAREIQLAQGLERLDIALLALPSLLEPVTVVSKSQCPRRDDTPRAFALLQQARDGLLNAIVARRMNPARIKLLNYQRSIDGDHVLAQSVRVDSQLAPTSYVAIRSGAQFVEQGFVTSLRGQDDHYFGPDAETLLDDGFAEGYCFRLAEGDRARPNQAGLAFSAAQRSRGRVDIDGTLWIDTLTRRLVDIDYRYVGLPPTAPVHPGGSIAFQEMPNGVMLTDHWAIRMPKQEVASSGADRSVATAWYSTFESGGVVARARWAEGTTWQSHLGRLSVNLVHHDGTPATGVHAQLLETDYSGKSDTAGIIVIGDLLPGPYELAVVDSILASLDISAQKAMRFSVGPDSVVTRRLEISDAADFTRDRCGKRESGPQLKLLLGKVEAGDGTPVKGATLEFMKNGPGKPFASFKTGTDGIFQLCVDNPGQVLPIVIWVKTPDGAKRTIAESLSDHLSSLLIKFDSPH